MKISRRRLIEIIQEEIKKELEELDETSCSAGVAGYATPNAFNKKGVPPSVLGQAGMKQIGLSATVKKKKRRIKKTIE